MFTFKSNPNTLSNSVKSTLDFNRFANKSAYKSCLIGMTIGVCAFTLPACQTIKPNVATNNGEMISTDQSAYPELLQSFNIRGKIGVTTPQTDTTTAQTGSAFYVWAQQDNRFAIDITGALGIGHTVIEYNGTSATLVSERTGKISANTPEALLQQATGWQAPISQLRYWISGRPAPSDNDSQVDEQGRIQTSKNGDWLATFDYNDNGANNRLPYRIKVVRTDGHRVIMTINHSQ